LKPQQYIVCYSDAKGTKVHIYGPFVSDSIAADFCDDLPEPVSGHKGIKPLSTYTQHEVLLAAGEILQARQSQPV
jgi:hypothetical protein